MGTKISCFAQETIQSYGNISASLKSSNNLHPGEENVCQTEQDIEGIEGKIKNRPSIYKERFLPITQPSLKIKLPIFPNKTNKLIPIDDDQLMKEFKKSTKKLIEAKAESSQSLNLLRGINLYKNILSSYLPEEKQISINGQIFFRIRKQPIHLHYQLLEKIGEGAFGNVFQAICLQTKERRAIKILKMKLMSTQDMNSFTNEVNILKEMDHINIIKIYDIFSYQTFFYVVTEYCEGGSLLEVFRKNLIKNEKTIQIVMRQLFSAMAYMHKKNVVHRDIKFENIVLVSKFKRGENQNINIKIIDFGLATKVDMKINKCGIVGTPSYIPPEILLGKFCLESDVWSCGILLCILLAGKNPFKHKIQKQTFRNIAQLSIDFQKDPIYRHLTEQSRDLLGKMLQKRPEYRITMIDCLRHPFIHKMTTFSDQIDMKYKEQAVLNITNFTRGSNFTCLIKNYLISKKSSQSYRQEMARIFEQIDSDGSGMIQKQQLFALYEIVTGSTPNEVQKYLKKIDLNKSNKIDFTEFLMVMSDDSVLQNKAHLKQAFQFFDSDQTGYIQKNELMECLSGCEEQDIFVLMEKMDSNGDGRISFQEFFHYMLHIEV